MNIDQQEVKKFAELAEKWWDKTGEFKPLHIINPLRANYIAGKLDLSGKNLLDVGCGGGILAEALHDYGANVTGLDAAGPGIEIAKMHAKENNKSITYFELTAEQLLADSEERFDVVTCLEVLEHVPDPELLVKTCINLLKPEGLLFLSTINKNPRSWITAIVGAEYILRWLPIGTHDWNKFLKPEELEKLLQNEKFSTLDIKGLEYNPILNKWKKSNNLSVNYIISSLKN